LVQSSRFLFDVFVSATVIMKLQTEAITREEYNHMLESFYHDLLRCEKSGLISSSTHESLETFLVELRELVADVNAAELRKAA
jgi:hypothetical protein